MKEFNGILAFVDEIATMIIAQEIAGQVALERAAVLVEERAKEKIGEYQDAAAPFAGWAQLADSTMADRAAQGYPEDEPLLRTGGMRDSIQHTVGLNEAHIGSNDDKAVWQELGTFGPHPIPPRSFLGGAAVEKLPEIKEIFLGTVTAALVGEKVFNKRMEIE